MSPAIRKEKGNARNPRNLVMGTQGSLRSPVCAYHALAGVVVKKG